MCIDGTPRTVCSDVMAARSSAGLCHPKFRCPAMDTNRVVATYSSPAGGTSNCRDAWTWSSTDGEYATRLKVCDTQPAQGD